MAQRRNYDNLLIIAGLFLVFFVITIIGIPLLVRTLQIDSQTRDGLLIASALQALVMFIAPSLVAARAISRRPGEFLTLNHPPRFLAILGVVFAYLIALPALNQLIYWNDNIVFPDALATWGETLREMEDTANNASAIMLDTTGWVNLVENLLVIGLLTAIGEELFFRGTLQNAAGAGGHNHTAIWVVALIFSAMHMQIFGFVPRLLLGAWFGYLLFWTRSIYVPIIAHFLNNGVVVVFAWLKANGTELNLDNLGVVEYGFPMPAFVSALATIVFLIYFRRFFFQRPEKGASYYSAEYA